MRPERNEERETQLQTLIGAEKGRTVCWLRETDSTNRQLRLLAEEGAAGGTVLLADAQTMGRGRQGRSFASPAGGLYLSVLFRPDAPEAAECLTPWAAVAVARAVKQICGLRAEIKWVNDLFCNGRKLCGILTEGVFREGRIRFAVLGVGLNVSATAEDFPPELRGVATSIRQELGVVPDRAALAAAVIRELDALPRLRDADAYLREYRASCCTLGKPVILTDGTEGFAEDIDERFALLMRLPDGRLRRVQSGEASLRKPLTEAAAPPSPTGE